MKSFFNLREATKKMTARDKWNKASNEREKKHNEIEAKRQDALKQGKENMSASIDRLAARFNTEQVESTPLQKAIRKKYEKPKVDREKLNIQHGGKNMTEASEVSHFSVHAFSPALKKIGTSTHKTKNEADNEGHNYSAQGHVVVQHHKDGTKKVVSSSFEPGTDSMSKSEMKDRALKESIAEAHTEFRIDHSSNPSGDIKSTFADHSATVSDTTDKATYVKVPSHKADAFKQAMKNKHNTRVELAEASVSAGELADKAYGISSKGPSSDAIKAHRAAAKAYEKEGDKILSQRHNEIAQGHMKSMTQA